MEKERIFSFIKENRNFCLLWTSQILSQITLNMINFVMATRIYEKTASTLAVSFLWIFYYLPSFFLGPFSGFLVDLLSKRKILIFANFLQSLIMILFLFVGENLYPIYTLVFLYSLLNQFYNPAEAASIPSLVQKADLPLANSLFLFTAQGALVLGLGFSGILMRLFGMNNPIWISIFSLLLATVAVYFLPKDKAFRKNIVSDILSFWEEIKDGYSFVKNTRIILFPILLMIFFQIFLVVLGVAIPSFSSKILMIRIQDAGPLLIIPLALGALSGTFVLTKYRFKYRKRTLMKSGFLAVLILMIFLAFVLPLLGKFKIFFVIPLMYLGGLSGFFISVPNQTLIQEHTPPRLRGRVYGMLGFLGNILTLPFLLFTATIVDLVGIKLFIFFAAMIIFFMLLFFDKVENYILSGKAPLSYKKISYKNSYKGI